MPTPAELLEQIVALVKTQNTSQQHLLELVDSQNSIIENAPSKGQLRFGTIVLSALILITVLISTLVSIDASRSAAKIGRQNDATVLTYCSASPTLPECIVPGSATAKASAILANCRIFADLAAVSTANSEQAKRLPTVPGCTALGF